MGGHREPRRSQRRLVGDRGSRGPIALTLPGADPTNPTDRVVRTAGQATIGGIVAGVLVAFGVVTEAQGIAVAPLITVVAAFAQNWRG